MGQHELPGGIAARVAGLTAALISHVLAIAALAADETRALIQRSVISLILVIALIASLLIAYLALVLTAIAVLTFSCGWSLISALGAATLIHLLFASILFIIVRMRRKTPLFETTSAELRRDLDSLDSYSKRPASENSPS